MSRIKYSSTRMLQGTSSLSPNGREKYKDSETVRQLTPLLARQRDRWVTAEDEQPLA